MILNKAALKKLFLNIKKGDYAAINRALVYLVFNALGLFLAVPVIILLWILKPFCWIKVGKLHHGRIGHLGLETDLFLRRCQLGIFSDKPFYFFLCDSRNVANRQLLEMFKRVLRIYESRILVSIFDGISPLFKRTPFYQALGVDYNEYFEFNHGQPSIGFTPDEIQKGRKLLSKMNIDFDNDKYVCVFARDSVFLNKTMSHQNWEYHNNRNADIDTFIEAIKYLIEEGFTVVRVGSVVLKPISYSHPRLIDYSVSEYQCEFLDIFFMGTCRFFIGSPSGIGDVATIFDIPMVNVSMCEFSLVPFGKNCLHIRKKFKLINTGQYLDFKKGVELKLAAIPKNLQELGLELENNNSHEILEITKEIVSRLEGTFKYSPEEEKLIKAYRTLWAQSKMAGCDVPTPIGIGWLKENQDLYF